MLDARYKKPARALKLYGVCLILALVAAAVSLIAYFSAAVSPELATLLAIPAILLDVLAAIGFAVGTFAITVYATIPAESGARTSALVAAISATIQLLFAFGSLASLIGLPEGLAALTGLLEPLLAMITLLAMTRSLSKLGLYIRDDDVYSRASMLFTGLVLLVLLWVGTLATVYVLASAADASAGSGVHMVLAGWSEGAMAAVVVAGLFTLVGAILVAIGYAILVFRAGRSLDDLIYE